MPFIGIDVGGSFLKGAVLDPEYSSPEHVVRTEGPPLESKAPLARTIDPFRLSASVGDLVNHLTDLINGEPDGVYFDREVYLPFWEASEKLDVPIYMHPRNPLPQHSRAYEDNPWLKGSPWAFAAETSIHALRLMTSGVFDAFPRAQLIIGHLGEHIPYDIWRIDHRLEKSPQGIPAKKSIREYMTENVHLTTAGKFYDPALHFAMGEVGVERIMFSADYPYETMSDAVNWFDNADLSEEDRLKIGRTNAIELLKLDLK